MHCLAVFLLSVSKGRPGHPSCCRSWEEDGHCPALTPTWAESEVGTGSGLKLTQWHRADRVTGPLLRGRRADRRPPTTVLRQGRSTEG